MASTMPASFPKGVRQRQVGTHRMYLRWDHAKLNIVVCHMTNSIFLHGEVLPSAHVVYARTGSCFTFLPRPGSRTSDFDLTISNAEQLTHATRELKKLFRIQVYQERESALAASAGSEPT